MKLYAGDGPPTPRKKQAAAPAERPAPTLKSAPAPKRKRANLKRKLSDRQGRLVQQYGEDYQSRTGRSLSGEAGIVRALLEENIAPVSKIRDVMNVSDERPDRREPLSGPAAPRPKRKLERPATAPQRLLPRHDDGAGGGLRFDVGDALSSWRDLISPTGSDNQDAASRDKRSPDQRQADALANMSPKMRAAFLRDQQRVADQGGSTEDPVAEAIIGGGFGGLGALGVRAATAGVAARAGGGLLAPIAEKGAVRLTTPTKSALRHILPSRPAPAQALSDFAGRSAAHRIGAGSALLASSGGAAKVSEGAHALGTKIRGGAPEIFVDPSTLNPVGQALAAGKTPTPKEKAAIELEHGPGRIGMTPEKRAQLQRQALANGWHLPANVSDFELIAKAYKRAGSTLQHLAAGFVENAGDYAFVPAFAGATYDAAKRSAGGEGATPFVDLAQQSADAAIEAIKHPIDNPLFAGAILKGGLNATGKASAKALRVKEQPLTFKYGEIAGTPDIRQYGTASANTLTRPAALLGQRLLNTERAGTRRRDASGKLKPSVQDRILSRQAAKQGQLIGVRASAAGALATKDLAQALSKLSRKEQILAVHSHLTGSPASNAARSHASELAAIEQRKADGHAVDESSLRALRAKAVEWDQLAQLEANLPAKSRARIDAFKAAADEAEARNQEHLAEWGVTPEEMHGRIWQQALAQHPTLQGELSDIMGSARSDLRSQRVDARRMMKESETRAAGLYRNAAKWQRQADALKGTRGKAAAAASGPPTHPDLDKIAASARARADKGDVSTGEYLMTADGSLGVVSGTVKGGSSSGLKSSQGRSVVKVHVRGADGKITTRTMTGRELAGAKARYRAQGAAAAPKVGKPSKRDVVFAGTDMAHPDQSVNVYPITHRGPIGIGVAKVTEETGHRTNRAGSRRGFNESWRVVVGDKNAVPRTFPTRAEAAAYAYHLDDALARGDSPKEALAHADEPHLNPATDATEIRKLPPAQRKVALAKRAEDTRALADQVQAAANQHAERLAALKAGHADLLEQRTTPELAAATDAAKADLAAQGFEPHMYVPQTKLDAGPATFLSPQSPFLTSGRDRLPAGRLQHNTGDTLRKGLVDERPSLALSAASKPAAIAQATSDIERFLRENGMPLDVPHKGMAYDSSKYVAVPTTKDGKLDRSAVTDRLRVQADTNQQAGLGNEDVNAGLLEAVFATVDSDHLPAGSFYLLPRVMRDQFISDARQEVARRNLAPGLRRAQRVVTSGMINVYPRTVLNNMGGRAMSAVGGVGPLTDYRMLTDQRARDLVPLEMRQRGVTAAQTGGVNVKEGLKLTLPARWWTQWFRDKNVRVEDYVRGGQAVHDLLKQAKEVQFGSKIQAAMHRVNDDTYAIAHGLRDTHPERYEKAIQHTIDFVGDFGKLSKYDPFLSIASPFWRWTKHILTATLVTMPKDYPLRATMLMTMGEVGRDYQREHGIWPSWMQGVIDLGEHVPGFEDVKGLTQAFNTSGAWPYATQSQVVSPGFDNVGVNPTQALSNATPLIPLAGSVLGVDTGQFKRIEDPNHRPVEPGSSDWLRAIGNRALQTFPTPYSFSGQEPTSLGPFGARYKDTGLPRRENTPLAIAGRAAGLAVSPVLTSGPELKGQGQTAFKRALSGFGDMPPEERAAMRRGWKAHPDGSISGTVPIP